jgi:hypothetical protein
MSLRTPQTLKMKAVCSLKTSQINNDVIQRMTLENPEHP